MATTNEGREKHSYMPWLRILNSHGTVISLSLGISDGDFKLLIIWIFGITSDCLVIVFGIVLPTFESFQVEIKFCS